MLEATRVIITVPHTVLRDKDIKFTPQLPESKITAFESLRMEPGLKVRRDPTARKLTPYADIAQVFQAVLAVKPLDGGVFRLVRVAVLDLPRTA